MFNKYYIQPPKVAVNTEKVDTSRIEDQLAKLNDQSDRVNISLNEYKRLKGIEASRDVLTVILSRDENLMLDAIDPETVRVYRIVSPDPLGCEKVRIEFSLNSRGGWL